MSEVTQGHENYVLLAELLGVGHGGSDCKELEIETANKMEKLLRWLLF
jgi:hypothetical protein